MIPRSLPSCTFCAAVSRRGENIRPGQTVRFLHTRGHPGVFAWDRLDHPDSAAVDVDRCIALLLRAAQMALQPVGVLEETLHGNAGYAAPPGYLPPGGQGDLWS